jgi:uncharacterized protein (TIGR03437 family)
LVHNMAPPINRAMAALRLFGALLFLAAAGVAGNVNYTYDVTGRLVQVDFGNGKAIVYSYDPAGNILNRTVLATAAGPTPAISTAGIVNAASFVSEAVAPGEMVTIFGAAVGPSPGVGEVINNSVFSSFDSDTLVLFDGVAAPIVSVSALQTSVLVPYSLAGKSSTSLQVYYQSRPSNTIQLPVNASAPGLFSANSSGKGNAAILNQDGSSNSPVNPAPKGSVIVLFETGEGQTNPPGVDGLIASGVLPKPVLPVSLTIGGVAAVIQYYGAAPGLVAGIMQVNAVVPAGIASGSVPVVLTVGNAYSQPGLTMSVK